MTRQRYAVAIGFLALAFGIMVLVRDAVEVHSIPYGIAGVGLMAFGAWRLLSVRRSQP
jgi:hypothetical protein